MYFNVLRRIFNKFKSLKFSEGFGLLYFNMLKRLVNILISLVSEINKLNVDLMH